MPTPRLASGILLVCLLFLFFLIMCKPRLAAPLNAQQAYVFSKKWLSLCMSGILWGWVVRQGLQRGRSSYVSHGGLIFGLGRMVMMKSKLPHWMNVLTTHSSIPKAGTKLVHRNAINVYQDGRCRIIPTLSQLCCCWCHTRWRLQWCSNRVCSILYFTLLHR